MWILFKSFFNWYIYNLTNTKLLFGYLASIPIFLFWIYANWIIILSGIIIVSILENRDVVREHHKREMSTIKITLEKVVYEDQIEMIKQKNIDKANLKEILEIFVKDEE